MARGKFITFEGGEGSGKSTQAARLAVFLKGAGLAVVATREPGGTLLGDRIRELVLRDEAASRDPLVAALLFNAARADHVRAKIRPALESGAWVICDRFLDSTRVYQGVAGSLDRMVVDRLEDIAVGQTRPDLTILCDIDPRIGLSRATERRRQAATSWGGGEPDPFESRDLAFHERLRAAFLDIAAKEPDRFAIIDAGADPDRVALSVNAVVRERLMEEGSST